MKKTLPSIAFTAVLLLFSIGVFSQSHPSKTEKITTLLELTGSAKIGTQIMDQIINSLSTRSKVSQTFWDTFRQEMNTDSLFTKIIPIYDKHFSESDIDGLIAFYQTDLGKRVIATLPSVMQESMQIGQEWGKQIAGKAMMRLKEEQEKDNKH